MRPVDATVVLLSHGSDGLDEGVMPSPHRYVMRPVDATGVLLSHGCGMLDEGVMPSPHRYVMRPAATTDARGLQLR